MLVFCKVWRENDCEFNRTVFISGHFGDKVTHRFKNIDDAVYHADWYLLRLNFSKIPVNCLSSNSKTNFRWHRVQHVKFFERWKTCPFEPYKLNYSCHFYKLSDFDGQIHVFHVLKGIHCLIRSFFKENVQIRKRMELTRIFQFKSRMEMTLNGFPVVVCVLSTLQWVSVKFFWFLTCKTILASKQDWNTADRTYMAWNIDKSTKTQTILHFPTAIDLFYPFFTKNVLPINFLQTLIRHRWSNSLAALTHHFHFNFNFTCMIQVVSLLCICTLYLMYLCLYFNSGIGNLPFWKEIEASEK